MKLRLIHAISDLKADAADEAETLSQLLYGERVSVIESRGAWSLVENERDRYRGLIRSEALAAVCAESEQRFAVLSRASLLLPRPDIKSPPLLMLPLGAELEALEPSAVDSRWLAVAHRGATAWALAEHLLPLSAVNHPSALDSQAMLDYAVAWFSATPYLWGGRSPAGCDCSGLVQLCAWRVGVALPRDSIDQQNHPALDAIEPEAAVAGDLLFWPGHVAIHAGEGRLFHANAHSMDARYEAIAEVDRRAGVPAMARRFRAERERCA